MPISDAVLLGEIISPGDARKDVIDRPREYAAAGVPFYLRVDCRERVPTLTLHELAGGTYRAVVSATGVAFAMRDPFVFTIDPGELLDEDEG